MSKNSQIHPCSGKCSRFDGEQCNTCLVSDDVCDFVAGDLVVTQSNEINFVDAVLKVIEVDGDQIRVLIDGCIRSYWTHSEGWRIATLAEIAVGHRIDEPKIQVVMCADELEITPYCVECDRKTLKVLHTAIDAQQSKQRAKLRVGFWKTAFAISGCINLLLIAAAMVGGGV